MLLLFKIYIGKIRTQFWMGIPLLVKIGPTVNEIRILWTQKSQG